jgi:hypothetical protein
MSYDYNEVKAAVKDLGERNTKEVNMLLLGMGVCISTITLNKIMTELFGS